REFMMRRWVIPLLAAVTLAAGACSKSPSPGETPTGSPPGTTGSPSPPPSAASSVTGTWSGHWTVSATINGPLGFHLTQTGQQVSGTVTFTSKGCSSAHRQSFTLPITGTVSGPAVQLAWHPSATSSFVSRWTGTELGT